MVLGSLYCWDTKVIHLLLGRALFLGAGTRAASPWRCAVAAGTWQELCGLTHVGSKDQGKGAFQELGIGVWDGTGSGCAGLAASAICHAWSLWRARLCPGVGRRGLRWPHSSPVPVKGRKHQYFLDVPLKH